MTGREFITKLSPQEIKSSSFTFKHRGRRLSIYTLSGANHEDELKRGDFHSMGDAEMDAEMKGMTHSAEDSLYTFFI